MNDTDKNTNICCKKHTVKANDALYCFGVIGALIYYFQHATTFGMVIFGIVKAIGWPAVVVYKVLQMLQL